MMQTCWLYIKAPFAAFRYFQAGVYRPSATFMTHSAAYGLLLNIAGIEMRTGLDQTTTDICKERLPNLRIAVGQLAQPEVNQIYQQMHSYPVGESGSKNERVKKVKKLKRGDPPLPLSREELAKGNKFWIAPSYREVLCNLEAVLGLRGEAAIIKKIELGLRGNFNGSRYGIPFAGENNFFFDRIEMVTQPQPARWYEILEEDIPDRESVRLSITIDRNDNTKTRNSLFILGERMAQPNEKAWIHVNYQE